MFTENSHRNPSKKLTASLITDFNNEYPTIAVKPNKECHDQYIILDYGTEHEIAFACGASSKDAGNKICSINRIYNLELLHRHTEKMLALNDLIL